MNLEQPTRRVNVERFNLITRNSFQHVLAALDAAVGRPNMDEFWKTVGEATTKSAMEKVIQSALGPSGFMEFGRFDHGGVVHKGEAEITQKFFDSLLAIR